MLTCVRWSPYCICKLCTFLFNVKKMHFKNFISCLTDTQNKHPTTVSCILKCRGYFQSESPLILNFIQLFFLKQSSSGVEKSLFTTSPARTLMQVRSNLPRPTVFIQVKSGWRYKWQTTWLPSVSNRCFNPNVQQSSMRLIDKSKDTRKYEGQK